jgi:hypothetical protein
MSITEIINLLSLSIHVDIRKHLAITHLAKHRGYPPASQLHVGLVQPTQTSNVQDTIQQA